MLRPPPNPHVEQPADEANATMSSTNPPNADSIPRTGKRALAIVFKPPISLPKAMTTITAGIRKTNPPMAQSYDAWLERTSLLLKLAHRLNHTALCLAQLFGRGRGAVSSAVNMSLVTNGDHLAAFRLPIFAIRP